MNMKPAVWMKRSRGRAWKANMDSHFFILFFILLVAGFINSIPSSAIHPRVISRCYPGSSTKNRIKCTEEEVVS